MTIVACHPLQFFCKHANDSSSAAETLRESMSPLKETAEVNLQATLA